MISSPGTPASHRASPSRGPRHPPPTRRLSRFFSSTSHSSHPSPPFFHYFSSSSPPLHRAADHYYSSSSSSSSSTSCTVISDFTHTTDSQSPWPAITFLCCTFMKTSSALISLLMNLQIRNHPKSRPRNISQQCKSLFLCKAFTFLLLSARSTANQGLFG